jgi:hypothetical protein
MNNDKFAVLREKQEEIKKLKEEMLEASNKIFTDLTKTIFEDHPKVNSFGWNQFTPYFNDGDTCYFCVNTDYIYINGESIDESDWINETKITNYGTWNREKREYEGRTEVPNLDYDSELAKAADEIREFLRNFDNDFFLSQFGDHAEITITAEGVSVDEYEHD